MTMDIDLIKLLGLDLSDRPITNHGAWLVWRQGKDGPEFLGLYSTQQEAEADIELLNRRKPGGWTATCLQMVGQGWIDRVRELAAYSAHFRRWQRDQGIEPSFAYELQFDHGTMVPLSLIMPKMDRPVVPVLFNTLAKPQPSAVHRRDQDGRRVLQRPELFRRLSGCRARRLRGRTSERVVAPVRQRRRSWHQHQRMSRGRG